MTHDEDPASRYSAALIVSSTSLNDAVIDYEAAWEDSCGILTSFKLTRLFKSRGLKTTMIGYVFRTSWYRVLGTQKTSPV